ncbi:hypothetical protein LZ32DRAFT_118289 [Colletotrichum eremochloae]|nr:hypothetical protein LZ32DRAFT_118289 [Colletotrichum eremochloae]
MSSKPFIRRVPVIVLMCFSLEVSRHNAAFPFPPPSTIRQRSTTLERDILVHLSSRRHPRGGNHFLSAFPSDLSDPTPSNLSSPPSRPPPLIPPKTPCSVSQFGDPSPHARTQNFFGSLALSIQQRAYLGHWSLVASKPPALPYCYVLCPQPTDLSDSRCPFTLEHCVARSRVYGVH